MSTVDVKLVTSLWSMYTGPMDGFLIDVYVFGWALYVRVNLTFKFILDS